MVRPEDYEQREQAFVKHFVLEHYLEQLALKVGGFRDGTTLSYIDGFSGPWQHADQELRDTSPHVAMSKLLAAKDHLQRTGKALHVRGFFVERNPDAHRRLQEMLHGFEGLDAVEARCGEFEGEIPAACRFAQRGKQPFAFIFIDPTGWTGYPLQAITPLLRVQPCEVLINFMTKDIVRFIDDESSTALPTFAALFGDAGYREAWRGLEGLEREDKIVETYCQRLRRAGDFAYVGATLVLNPQHDRTHYHLVHATRSLHGLIAFRETERLAVPAQREVRAGARQQRRFGSAGQQEMFDASTMETRYMEDLARRYQDRARRAVEARLREQGRVPFDELVGVALSFPMTSLHQLKDWLAELRRGGRVEYLGLGPRERVPKPRAAHVIEWRAGPSSGPRGLPPTSESSESSE
ncbi:MAG: three-Cys-motif partner protein TcmP [Myxococcales bacterium]|nr:three-Cys-motif partner protein TcmP [Myxococcales bacterium]